MKAAFVTGACINTGVAIVEKFQLKDRVWYLQAEIRKR